MNRTENENGFTLIEMMIVLLIISVLILVAIPNVTKHSQSIDEKGCEAYKKMVQGQVEAYKMEKKSVPTIAELIDEEYLPEEAACPNGSALTIDEKGEVSEAGQTETP